MSYFLSISLLISLVFSVITGNVPGTGRAALEGAPAAVEFCLGTGGLICLWSGVMEVMRRAGLMAALSRLLTPALSKLFPRSARDADTMEALASNVSANILGLGNAATPMGIRAAAGMARLAEPGEVSSELCLLVVMNTASIQLLPTTVASVRSAYGAQSPFDILPAVWITSVCSLAAGIVVFKVTEALRSC